MHAMRVGAGLVLLSSLIASCGGGSGSAAPKASASAQQAPGSTTTSAAGTPAASAAPSASATPLGPQYRILSKAALGRALLTLDEAPNGYADTTTAADRSANSRLTYCNYKPPFAHPTYVAKVFTKGGGLSSQLLNINIRQYASEPQAKASFAKLQQVMRTCRTFKDYDGDRWHVSPVKADPVGQASLQIRLEVSGMTGVQGVSLVGPSVIQVTAAGQMAVDGDLVPQVLADLVARYSRAAER